MTFRLPEETSGLQRATLNEDKVYNDSLEIKFADGEQFSNPPEFSRLAKQDYITDTNGVPSGTPTANQIAVYQNYGGLGNSWYNVGKYKVWFELDGLYDLEYFYLNMQLHGNSNLSLWGSTNGVDRIQLYDSDVDAGYDFGTGTWNKVLINKSVAKNIKYIAIGVTSGSMQVKGITAYGFKKSTSSLKGIKYIKASDLTTVERIGTNSFYIENDFDMIGHVASWTRTYNNPDWILAGPYKSAGNPTATVDDVSLALATSHMWNYIDKLTQSRANGWESLLTISSLPVYMRASSETNISNDFKPLDPGLDRNNIAVTTNPQSYKHMARICAMLAGVLGSNTNVNTAYLKVDNGSTIKALGLVKYYEFGNENDKNWQGENAYRNPQEQAAELSAYYDGHKGALGPFMGLKAGDPNAKLVMPGLAAPNYAYMWEMFKWWDLNRGVGDYPIDVVNFHHYNSEMIKFNTGLYSTDPWYGMPPEKANLISHIKHMIQLKNQFKPALEVWCTEIGYGEQKDGVLAPRDSTKYLRGLHKSAWLIRTMLISEAYGMDRVAQYWYANDQIRIEDLTESDSRRDMFLTMGYVDGITAYNDRSRKGLQSYWFMRAFRNDLKDYVYQAIVYSPEYQNSAVLGSNVADAWVLSYKHKTTNQVIFVAWIGTDQWTTANTTVYVGSTGTPTIRTYPDDLPTNQLTNGVITTPVISGTGSQRSVPITLTEMPKIITVTQNGSPRLIQPSHLEGRWISQSSFEVSWTDENINNVNVTIRYKGTSGESYTTLTSNAVNTDCKALFTISNPTAIDKHYVQVQFTSVTGEHVASLTKDIIIKK
jgi:hypothetical protein